MSEYRRQFEELNNLEQFLVQRNLIVRNYYPEVVFLSIEISEVIEYFGNEYYLNKLKFYYDIHPCATITGFYLSHFNDICPSFEFRYETPTKFTFPYSKGCFYNGVKGGNRLRNIDIITPRELVMVFGQEYYNKMILRNQYKWFSDEIKWKEEFKKWKNKITIDITNTGNDEEGNIIGNCNKCNSNGILVNKHVC